jgi:hypothetical protein
MIRLTIVIILIVASLLSESRAQLPPTLKVGIVFTAVGASSSTDAINQFNDIRDLVTEGFTDSGMTAPTLVRYTRRISLLGGLLEPFASLDDYRDRMISDTKVRDWRNNQDIDLIIVVAGNMEQNPDKIACGQAYFPINGSLPDIDDYLLNGISPIGSGDFRYVGVAINSFSNCTKASVPTTVIHEIGHLMYGDHQPSEDSDGDTEVPVEYNHAAYFSSSSSQYTTIMGVSASRTNVFSGVDTTFGPGGLLNTLTAVTNNKKVFLDDNLHTYVAMYRPKLTNTPTASIDCYYEFVNCQNMKKFITSWQNVSGYNVEKVFWEKSWDQSTWYPVMESTIECTPVQTASTLFVRLLMLTKNSGLTEPCTLTVPGGSCGGGGGVPN